MLEIITMEKTPFGYQGEMICPNTGKKFTWHFICQQRQPLSKTLYRVVDLPPDGNFCYERQDIMVPVIQTTLLKKNVNMVS